MKTCTIFAVPTTALLLAVLFSLVFADSGLLFAQSRSSANRYRMMLRAMEDQGDTSQTSAQEKASELERSTAGDALEGPVDNQTYVLGPGDELTLLISGKDFETAPLVVLPEGDVIIQNSGAVKVAGKTIAQAESLVTRLVMTSYRDARVRLVLTRMRHFRVFVAGFVLRMDAVLVTPMARVSEVIERVGGLNKKGNAYLRRIRVTHRDGSETMVDLYPFYLGGDLSCNPRVQDGDIVYLTIKSLTNTVSIYGEVGLQGEFQFAETDSFSSLVRVAQGFLPSAFLDSIEVSRFTENGISAGRFYVDCSASPQLASGGGRAPFRNDFPLRRGDQIFVREIPKWHMTRTVAIAGEVRYPGKYAIAKDSAHLSELIERARGFTDEAAIEEAEIIRRSGTTEVDREFERLAKMIPSEMTREEYEYFKAKARERPGVLVVDFSKLFKQHDLSEDIILRDDDSVYIPSTRNYVSIIGRVNTPGRILFSATMTFDDYIQKAGGYGFRADESSVRIIKARTGENVDPRKSTKTSIEPGDTIFVPEESETNIWPAVLQTLGILTQVFGILVGVYAITRK